MTQDNRRRDVVDSKISTTLRDSRVPLAPVMTPRPSSQANAGSEYLEVSRALSKTTDLLNRYVDKKIDEALVEGKLAYAEGKTEEEIDKSGNYYYKQGYKSMSFVASSNEWLQTELDNIESEGYQLDPEEYRQKLMDGFKSMSDTLGDSPEARNLLVGIAERSLPKLLEKQVVANNEFNKESTITSYRDMLVSDSMSTDEELIAMADTQVSQLDTDTHNSTIADAMYVQGMSGNTRLLDVLAPNAKTYEDFIKLGYKDKDAYKLSTAYKTASNIKSTEFNQERLRIEDTILQGVSNTGNISEAISTIEDTKNNLGFNDTWANNMLKRAMSIAKDSYKTSIKNTVVDEAINNKTLYKLKGNNLKAGLKKLRQTATLKAINDPRLNELDDQERSIAENELKREYYYKELMDNGGIVDKETKANLSLSLSKNNILSSDGKVNPKAVSAFRDYALVNQIGGKQYANKYLSDGYSKDVILLANDYSKYNDVETSLLLAAAELDDKELSAVDNKLIDIDDAVFNETVEDAVNDLIYPDGAIVSNIKRLIGRDAPALGIFDIVKDSEIESAYNDPTFRAEIKRSAYNELVKLKDSNYSIETKNKLAIKRSVEDVIARSEFVLGNIILNPKEGKSIKELTNTVGKNNVLHVGVSSIIKEIGRDYWGDAFNEFQFFDTGTEPTPDNVNDPSIESVIDKVRGVPSMNIQYHSPSGNLIIRPYLDKERYNILDKPLVINIKDAANAGKGVIDNYKTPLEYITGGFKKVFEIGNSKSIYNKFKDVDISPISPAGASESIYNKRDVILEEASDLVDLIVSGESSVGGYHAVAGLRKNPALTSMTINEVIEYQMETSPDNKYGSAAGRYQFIRTTLEAAKKRAGLTGDELFSEDMQDLLFTEQLRYRGWDKFKAGEMSYDDFIMNLGQEWASLAYDSKNKSYYKSDINESTVKFFTLMDVLSQYTDKPPPNKDLYINGVNFNTTPIKKRK